ncbi:DUF5700 domain-containing putative Zn-dependent protease [Clostridium manihotivorum]|uniref:DUF2268 domain-containing protein n=1 Tax=Clostridium manihotivorum TaxID=2320868 RepID=A0A410DQL7_9CLOT|nr:DUF5700 domain-containing putative Zn-dependent protease [Clostridium manihotivorum]QAA31348.1 hypothetical protein C1I91_06655 [Clostridium manihotivorum]
MSFSISFSSINSMLQLCKRLTNGQVMRSDVESLLDHEDYKFELERYSGRLSKDEFVDYFLQINNIEEDDITNIDLKSHHSYYKDLLANVDYYFEKLKELESILTPELIEEQVSIALKGLPDDIILPDIKFIFTISIGRSFGYVYENCTHFDFLQLVKDQSISAFCSTIAHEVHHVGLNTILQQIDGENLSLEGLFYLYFSGEGLAVKYCNNAEGVLSKSIYNATKNQGLDAFTWKYLNDDFYNTMDNFRKTVSDIRAGIIKSPDDLNKLMSEYWTNPYTEEQNKSEIPKLRHFRVYTFGNDIWGVIHDCFGKNTVFETLRNPDSFPVVFNKALDKIGYGQFKI